MKAVDIYAKYAKDHKKEMVEGAKFYLDKENNSYISVLRFFARNKEWAKESAELAKKAEQFTEDELEVERNKLAIKHFVVGWNNIADESGNEIPFDKETAEKVLLDLPDLFEDLFAFALNGDNYTVDKVAKN